MESRPFLVTGMVRSGTSLVSRAIDAHPEIACPPEPCLGFFRAFRNELLSRTEGGCPDPESPFTDFTSSSTLALERHLEADLSTSIEFESTGRVIERMRRFNEGTAEPIVERLDEIEPAETYRDLFVDILELLGDVYGSPDTRAVGFKQTWIEAFCPALFGAFEGFRCIHIVRDPRGVVASWLETENLTHDYPLLMVLRHWRKSAALASRFSKTLDGYEVVRYEDFVSNPEEEARAIAKSLEVPYDPAMLDFGEYRDGMKENWTSNTSYDSSSEITAEYVDRWETRLDHADLQFIEDLCHPELRRWDYPRTEQPCVPASLMDSPALSKQFPGESEWIRQYSERFEYDRENRARELYRWTLIDNADELARTYPAEYEDVFLDPDLVGPSPL